MWQELYEELAPRGFVVLSVAMDSREGDPLPWIEAGKPTYPALYGLDASKRMADECLGRAAAALADVRLADSRLLQIGRWIVERSN